MIYYAIYMCLYFRECSSGALDFLSAKHNYWSCRGAAKLYGVKLLSGDMARIRDIAPAYDRGFVIFEVRHSSKPQR